MDPKSNPTCGACLYFALIWLLLSSGRAWPPDEFHADGGWLRSIAPFIAYLRAAPVLYPLPMQAAYSIGVGLGMAVFFNQLSRRRRGRTEPPGSRNRLLLGKCEQASSTGPKRQGSKGRAAKGDPTCRRRPGPCRRDCRGGRGLRRLLLDCPGHYSPASALFLTGINDRVRGLRRYHHRRRHHGLPRRRSWTGDWACRLGSPGHPRSLPWASSSVCAGAPTEVLNVLPVASGRRLSFPGFLAGL